MADSYSFRSPHTPAYSAYLSMHVLSMDKEEKVAPRHLWQRLISGENKRIWRWYSPWSFSPWCYLLGESSEAPYTHRQSAGPAEIGTYGTIICPIWQTQYKYVFHLLVNLPWSLAYVLGSSFQSYSSPSPQFGCKCVTTVFANILWADYL